MDPFTIISSVAAVISAYHSASKIIDNIKAKRKARQAPPILAELERSVDQAPNEIETEKAKGVSRFGKAFEQGDYMAVMVIQDAAIKLQSNLLDKLHQATIDDTGTDFTTLTDESDLAQARVKGALLECYSRKIQGVSLPSMLEMTYMKTVPSPLDEHRRSLVKESGVQAVQSNALAITNNGSEVNNKSNKPRKRSFVEKIRRTSKTESQQLSQVSDRDTERDRLLARPATNSPQTTDINPPAYSYRYELGEDNPFDIWGDDGTDSRVDSAIAIPRAKRTPILEFRMPTPENKYLGFCKAAWKLQNGDRKAMTTIKMGQYSRRGSISEDLVCSHCKYHLPMNQTALWKDVRTLAPQGISFRWSFMAKSHVPHKKFESQEFLYMCLFCAFLGREMEAHKSGALLEHISSEHRGTELSDVVLNRTNCVDDRVCRQNEEFDVNLWPLNGSGHSSLRGTSFTSTRTDGSTSRA